MKTVCDPAVLGSLIARLHRVTPGAERRWGALTSHEMLCHLGDAFAMVTRTRPRIAPISVGARPLHKMVGLWSPMRWPQGRTTNPRHNPREEGTSPSVFERDRARVIIELQSIAIASPSTLEGAHGLFGTMSTRDWQRWAYKHADHHLRQFGA